MEVVIGDEMMAPVMMPEVLLVITVLAEVDERLSGISLLDELVASLVVVESAMEVVCSVPSGVITEMITEEASIPV